MYFHLFITVILLYLIYPGIVVILQCRYIYLKGCMERIWNGFRTNFKSASVALDCRDGYIAWNSTLEKRGYLYTLDVADI